MMKAVTDQRASGGNISLLTSALPLALGTQTFGLKKPFTAGILTSMELEESKSLHLNTSENFRSTINLEDSHTHGGHLGQLQKLGKNGINSKNLEEVELKDNFLVFIDNCELFQVCIGEEKYLIYKILQRFGVVSEKLHGLFQTGIIGECSLILSSPNNMALVMPPTSAHNNTNNERNNTLNSPIASFDYQQSTKLDIKEVFQTMADDIKTNSGMWINGIRVDYLHIQENLIHTQQLRRQTDRFLLRIDRRFKTILYNMRIGDEEAIMLTIQITLLRDYLTSSESRIILFQIIDILLESILMIKKLLIDLSLQMSIIYIYNII